MIMQYWFCLPLLVCVFCVSEGSKCLLVDRETNDLLNDICNIRKDNNCSCKAPISVAFQADAMQNQVNLPYAAVVQFEKVSLNKGDAYNPKTGKFTAPKDGIYGFTWTVMTESGSAFHTMFVVNGKDVSRGYLDLTRVNNYFMSTKTQLVELKKGSTAWVRSDGGNVLISGFIGFASFNGHKIQ